MPFVLRISFSLLALAACACAAGNNWMTALDGTLALSRFSIPGTHDSGARFESFSGTAKCQDLTIAEQLAAGVRFLDVRCRHLDNAFVIHHGSVYQNIGFTDVLNDAYGFLNANPGETIIMSVKEEYDPSGNTRTFEATFDSYVALNPSKWLPGSAIPTLNRARGKIVLFRRFGAANTPKGINASTWPDNTTFSNGSLRVQDNYLVTNNDTKWSNISSLLNEARNGPAETLYVNFSSGYISGFLGFPSITSVSNNINPRLATFFTANPTGRFGTVLMDFADGIRAALIYNTNPVPLPPLVIPNVSLGTESSFVTLSWPSPNGYVYQPYRSDDLVSWQKLTPAPIAGDGSILSASEAQSPSGAFYQLFIAPAP